MCHKCSTKTNQTKTKHKKLSASRATYIILSGSTAQAPTAFVTLTSRAWFIPTRRFTRGWMPPHLRTMTLFSCSWQHSPSAPTTFTSTSSGWSVRSPTKVSMALYSRNLSSPQAKEGRKEGKGVHGIISGIKSADNNINHNITSWNLLNANSTPIPSLQQPCDGDPIRMPICQMLIWSLVNSEANIHTHNCLALKYYVITQPLRQLQRLLNRSIHNPTMIRVLPWYRDNFTSAKQNKHFACVCVCVCVYVCYIERVNRCLGKDSPHPDTGKSCPRTSIPECANSKNMWKDKFKDEDQSNGCRVDKHFQIQWNYIWKWLVVKTNW